jgi:hypothetical protein
MELAIIENSVVTPEMLISSPTHAAGFSHTFERDIRIMACNFIDSATILLKLTPLTASTAQVLIQRFYFMNSIDRLPIFVSFHILSELECNRRSRLLGMQT